MAISKISPLMVFGASQPGSCNCPFCKAQAAGLASNPQGSANNAQSSPRLQALKSQDKRTRAHEQAHLSAAGSFATSAPVYNLETGPDGNDYANGGHVGVDLSPIAGNPQATIAKMQTIQRSALAPDDPSGQDYSVASQAQALLEKAQTQLSRQQQAPGSAISVVA